MSDLKDTLGLGGFIVVILLLLCLGPALFLWSFNSLAEIANVDVYIEHGLWSYWVTAVFLFCVRGS